jgi:hydroxyacylglutathione hydrolase
MLEVSVIETSGLGDRSYLVRDGEVAVAIDPQRDIDRVLELAGNLRITHVLETHIHNDYVTGGLALTEPRSRPGTWPAHTGSSYPARSSTTLAGCTPGVHP